MIPVCLSFKLRRIIYRFTFEFSKLFSRAIKSHFVYWFDLIFLFLFGEKNELPNFKFERWGKRVWILVARIKRLGGNPQGENFSNSYRVLKNMDFVLPTNARRRPRILTPVNAEAKITSLNSYISIYVT